MLTNMRGQVEADPMRIPAPSRMTPEGAESFARHLDRAAQTEPAAEPVPEPAKAPVEPAAEPRAAERAKEADGEPREHVEVGAQSDSDSDTAAAAAAQQGAQSPDVTQALSRGESERRESAGKGPDSPRTSRSPGATAEPLIAAVLQQGAQDRGVAVAPTGPAVTAIGAAKAGEAPTRGIDAAFARPSLPTRAAAVAPGYRANGAVSAELLEQARDSVFKQILMQLDGDGGEMRLRLQPPEFGELDLRLLVERGNKLSLTIAAERADVTQLLQKHLDELKQTLQASGLEVTDAQVHQRSAGGARDERPFADRDRYRGDDDAADATAANAALRRGYVTAEGLDFWA